MKKLFLFLLILPICFFVYLLISNQPVNSLTTKKDFVISEGDGLSSIAKRLEENKFIRSQYTFIVYTLSLGYKSKIPSGKFRLPQNLSTKDLIKTLAKGGSSDYWLKIIDGQRVEEITPRFPKTDEGYLFPDSYLIPDYYTPEEIRQMIKNNFDKKLAKAKEGATVSITDKDAVILASLLEREARSLEIKQQVAGILFNRLDANMGLNIDASIQYAKDTLNKPEKYWQPISGGDTSVDSPYNTYKYRGLPPGPICNPGYNSLYAIFHPTSSDYIYYITSPEGNMYFAKTLSEHNLNVARYLK